ncbi:hypothetical protein DDZ13_01250 [Coraliomargarita sinensis]|uniref:O-antigen ligase-related domain-containing protein n=1 Tax=Coraliomargarita sinensis TaxID=2174842 RepID=A0A317ZMV9_9BACT|nr:O-antigen ligase family protein [Coraliomargarita sinensis]PXA05527.1 hypothetical protein DDZ13_01250 [Coraliomargarita sinensis]
MEGDPWKKKRRRSKQKRHRSHSPGGRKGQANISGEYAKRHSRKDVAPTSSFASIQPSSAPITVEVKKEPPPVWLGYLLGLAGVTLLILLGGGHNVYALALSLLLPGVALLAHPPQQSPGLWLDRAAIAFLAFLLLAFVPSFYWPEAEWRSAARDIFQIELPASLSVQPWGSFEAWVSALAGFAWFYAASSWKINHQGRRSFYLVLSLVLGLLSLVVLWGNMSGAKYPSAEDSTVFSFFPNRNQTANFLAVGGVVAFGYAMCALRSRRLTPILGVIVSGLCFLALVWGISRAGVLLFFTGIVLGYVLQLACGRIPRGIKLGFPLFLLAFSVFIVSNSRTTERIVDFAASAEGWSEEFRVLMAKDTWAMIKSAPLAGHGLGSFPAVFPQYRELSANHQRAVHPESDVLWLTAETGLLGSALFLGFLVAYLIRCRGLSHGPSGGYRIVAMAALFVFLLHSFVDVSGHRPGTVYFAILIAALALPHDKAQLRAYRPLFWRACGAFLVLVGLMWGLGGVTGLPLHSSIAVERKESRIEESIELGDYTNGLDHVDKWIGQRPLDWRAYFQRATLTLSESGARARAAADFRRARFVEPNIGVVALEEGYAWLDYDPERTIAAWRELFSREFENRDSVFRRILNTAERNQKLLDGLARLSDLYPEFRVYFLNFQSGDFLMQELARDLKNDPRLSLYTREQRTSILKNWIRRGDREAAKEFLQENASGLNQSWWLWSLLHKEQAKFESAVQYIRGALNPPELPEVKVKGVPLERLKREFSVVPGDVMKGTALLHVYIAEGNFQKVREVAQTMISAQREVPLYVLYWHAESYFHLEDYIETWYAYERYLKKLWDEDE